ncbi:hypothetical protein B7463_g4960, partial [Scytalidium lignicola]
MDNNNEQQPEEDSEENSEEESEEGFKETIKETNIQERVLKKVVMLPKQLTKSTEGLTVRELSRASGKKLILLLLKLNLRPIQVLRALSLDLDLDFKLEDNVEQVLITTSKEVKIARLNLFYKDKKKLKAYLVQTRTYLVLNDHLLPKNIHKVL